MWGDSLVISAIVHYHGAVVFVNDRNCWQVAGLNLNVILQLAIKENTAQIKSLYFESVMFWMRYIGQDIPVPGFQKAEI